MLSSTVCGLLARNTYPHRYYKYYMNIYLNKPKSHYTPKTRKSNYSSDHPL